MIDRNELDNKLRKKLTENLSLMTKIVSLIILRNYLRRVSFSR